MSWCAHVFDATRIFCLARTIPFSNSKPSDRIWSRMAEFQSCVKTLCSIEISVCSWCKLVRFSQCWNSYQQLLWRIYRRQWCELSWHKFCSKRCKASVMLNKIQALKVERNSFSYRKDLALLCNRIRIENLIEHEYLIRTEPLVATVVEEDEAIWAI